MRRARTAALATLLGASIASMATPALAQWPGRLTGRVVDAETGEPAPFATLVVVGGRGVAAEADAGGAFVMDGLGSGPHTLEVSRLGYETQTVRVVIESGHATHLTVRLARAPLVADRVSVTATPIAGMHRFDRDAIRRVGARTLAEVLDRVPGVVVQGRGLGGPEIVSIRGSGARGVLVLLDGSPLNDPITGQADLSSVSLASVESVEVWVGSRSARFGARARAGAVIIESGGTDVGQVRLAAGSQGARAYGADAAGGGRSSRWGFGVGREVVDGAFDYRLRLDDGAIVGRRRNADRQLNVAYGAFEGSTPEGRWHLRTGFETGDRGLPGKAFAPSASARQSFDRLRVAGGWYRDTSAGTTTVSADLVRHVIRHRDPDPPLGSAYDDRTEIVELGLRGAKQRALAWGPVAEVEVQAEMRNRWLSVATLDARAPRSSRDIGFGIGIVAAQDLPWGRPVDLSLRSRLDRDDLTPRWFASHALEAGIELGPVRIVGAHRSAFAPPALGDLFFEAAIGVEPNPDLRAERVTNEVEIGASLGAAGSRGWAAGASAYRADVRDMIEWAPDFRFVWSPRNFDVERRGAELWASASPGAGFSLDLGYDYADARYASSENRGDGQIVYRPRHTARIGLEWRSETGSSAAITSRYTGSRTTVTADANRLPGFWTHDARLARRWSIGALSAETIIRVDRVTGQSEGMIFGFPEPARRYHFEVHLSAADRGRLTAPEKGSFRDES